MEFHDKNQFVTILFQITHLHIPFHVLKPVTPGTFHEILIKIFQTIFSWLAKTVGRKFQRFKAS